MANWSRVAFGERRVGRLRVTEHCLCLPSCSCQMGKRKEREECKKAREPRTHNILATFSAGSVFTVGNRGHCCTRRAEKRVRPLFNIQLSLLALGRESPKAVKLKLGRQRVSIAVNITTVSESMAINNRAIKALISKLIISFEWICEVYLSPLYDTLVC